MNHPSDAVYAEVRDTDPDTLDAEQLDGYLRRVAELRAWCDARQVRATRAQRCLADEGRAADPASSLSKQGRHSSRDAKAAAERETVCRAMPGFEDALAAGEVSSGHVDAVAAATKNLDGTEAAELPPKPDRCSPMPNARVSMRLRRTVVSWRRASAPVATPGPMSMSSSSSVSSPR